MGARERCADPAAPCELLARPRLNVTCDEAHSNAALRRTQAALSGFVRAGSLAELGATLERLRGCRLRRASRTLDLVAHGDSNGYLVLGTSVLGPGSAEIESFARAHGEALHALGFERLRLLGCYTAAGENARRAVAFVGQALRVTAFGCVDTVDETQFGVDGFLPKWESLLVSA